MTDDAEADATQEILGYFTEEARAGRGQKMSMEKYDGRMWSVTWEDGKAVFARPLD